MEIPSAIISDLDGTLIDTLHLIRHGQYEASKAYLAQQGIAESQLPDYDTYEGLVNQTVGGSARTALEQTVRLLYKNQPQHLENLNFNALHDMLNPIQDKIAPEFVKAYDGLSYLLNYLGEAGVKLAIFTSGTPYHVVRNFGIALPELDKTKLYKDDSLNDVDKLTIFEKALADHFKLPGFTIVTCDDTEKHKPDPQGINLAIKRLSVNSADVLVLGDDRVDMQAGVNAGVPQRVGVTHGFRDQASLEQAGATQVVHSLAELNDLLQS